MEDRNSCECRYAPIDMHELSVALAIVEAAAEEAARRGGVRVVAIHLKVGVLSGVVPAALTSAFELARAGSTQQDAALVVEEVPATANCPVCAAERPVVSVQQLCCSLCGSPTGDIVRGRELDIVELEIEA
jgi:hydrogenase nickel incorporation protein HypA/HybF